MGDHRRPITVRDVQAAMSLEGHARAQIARTLCISDRQLDLLVAERRALDLGAHAYLAEFDLDDD